MRNLIRQLSLTLVLLGLAACQTTDEYLATFHGMPKSRLLGQLGQPDLKESDGQGGEIWIYEEKHVSTPTATETETVETNLENGKKPTTKRQKQVAAPTPTVRLVLKSFYINADGVIYDTTHGSRYLQR